VAVTKEKHLKIVPVREHKRAKKGGTYKVKEVRAHRRSTPNQ